MEKIKELIENLELEYIAKMEKIKELIENLELEYLRDIPDKYRIGMLCLLINKELEKIKT